MHRRRVAALTAAMTAALLCAFGAPALAGERELADLSLEELANIEITSVSRTAEPLSAAPASIYVITSEDIRRSGVLTLPEALRLAPNLQVARTTGAQYAISSRGFNNVVANKLLVLVDGRTIYTPLFSGVFWDQQDVLLEDVERIEVISGPGATLWGANAVNGVINVITRSAAATQGTLAFVSPGTQDSAAGARHGGTLANGGHYRVYAKATQLGNTSTATGNAIRDGMELWQTGFRADWGTATDGFTLQGDTYKGESQHRGYVGTFEFTPIAVYGANLLGRWTRHLQSGDYRVQAYVDHADRNDVFLFNPKSDIFDVEFQHALPEAGRHHVLWGGGYRYGRDVVRPGVADLFLPASTGMSWTNAFVQDQIQLRPDLELTPGLKLETNRYTGTEVLPSVRLAWSLSSRRLVWAAVSRAVRAPSRFDREVYFPLTPPVRIGSDSFAAEVANVYELGYRAQPSSSFTWSATAFYSAWDRLRSANVPFQNNVTGWTGGLESWATWQATRRWRLSGGLTTLREHLHYTPGPDPNNLSLAQLGNDPQYQMSVRSAYNFTERQQFDVTVRHVSALPNPVVPAYTAVDARYAWRVRPDIEIALVGQNLLDPGHAEFGTLPGRSEIPRSMLLTLRVSR